MIGTIVYFGIVNLVLTFKLWWDYKQKNKGIIINHKMSALRDGAIYVVTSYFIYCFPSFCSFWFLFGIVLTSAGYRWIVFDLVFNHLNGWKWDHYGLSSWLDQKMYILGKYHLIPKVLVIVIGLILVYVF